MVRLTLILLKRFRLVPKHEDPIAWRHIKHGPVKWRDYKSPVVDPPYWYKWSLSSPYSPMEQRRIRAKEDVFWYRFNYGQQRHTPPEEWLFYVGDKVEITSGKDKGKQGDVVRIIPERNWVVVGGLNMKWKKHEQEMHAEEEPLEHHEVTLVDPADKKPTDVEFRSDDKGYRIRVSLRSGHVIPQPLELLHDRTPKIEYIEQDKDTPGNQALERTFVPSMKTLEEELKEIYKIEDPLKRETFWY